MPKEQKIWIIPVPNKKGATISVSANTLSKGGNLNRLKTHLEKLQQTSADTEPSKP